MSADDNPTQPLPDPTAQWVLSSAAAPEPRRRRWVWLVALLAVASLVVGAWFAGEYVARTIVERTIREQAVTQLSLPADQQIDIDLPGPLLPQLIVGNLAHITIRSDDVPLRGLTADVVVRADDVPIRGDGDWSGAYATVTMGEEQLRMLLAEIDGFPADTLTLDPPDVAVSFDLSLLVTSIPVGVALTPKAEQGDLVLTPTSLRVAGAEISAEAILRQFGAIASTVVRDWDVCIAEHLPAALTLTDVAVQARSVTAEFEIDSAILRDESARATGTCS